MKLLIAALFLMLPLSSMASSGDLIFVDGHRKGESVFETYIGYDEMCFTGNPYAVRTKAIKLMSDDIEKESIFVRVDTKNDRLVIGYVDTKCLDDSLDATPEGCRMIWIVPRCTQ